MKIRIENTEIEEAICDYIQKQGISLKNAEVTIMMTSGRRDRGHYADITIEPKKANKPESAESAETDEDNSIFANFVDGAS